MKEVKNCSRVCGEQNDESTFFISLVNLISGFSCHTDGRDSDGEERRRRKKKKESKRQSSDSDKSE